MSEVTHIGIDLAKRVFLDFVPVSGQFSYWQRGRWNGFRQTRLSSASMSPVSQDRFDLPASIHRPGAPGDGPSALTALLLICEKESLSTAA